MKRVKKTAAVFFVVAGLCLLLSGHPSDVQAQFELDLNKLQEAAETVVDLAKAAKPWTYPEERATGRVLAARVASSFGGVWRGSPSADAWTAYVNKIGRALVPYSNRPDIKYRFAILNTDEVNAYSCPGGYIFVTKGLLGRLSNEAQLAGVLAHEIGHVSERHIEKEVKKSAVAGVLLEHGLEFAAMEGEITREQAKILEKVSEVGWEVLVKKGYAKKDEFEADRKGTKNIFKLGYHPYGLRSFLETIEKEGKKGKFKVLVSTHPAAGKRVQKIKDYVEKDKGWNCEGRPFLKERLDKMSADYPL